MAPSTNYIWELGIDWNAIVGAETAGTSYLRQGFTLPGTAPYASTLTSLNVLGGDSITFKIFDVTSIPPGVSSVIDQLTITPRAAVNGQTKDDPFDSCTPTISIPQGPPVDVLTTAFGGSYPLLGTASVNVVNSTGTERFLLTFSATALGTDGTTRTFVHDPEMVVGEN